MLSTIMMIDLLIQFPILIGLITFTNPITSPSNTEIQQLLKVHTKKIQKALCSSTIHTFMIKAFIVGSQVSSFWGVNKTFSKLRNI
jgi:hypothetical protein